MRLVFFVLLTILSACPTTADASANDFGDHLLFPTTAGTAATSADCGMHASATLLQYLQFKADRTRFVFVRIMNPTAILGEVYATIVINGHAITALKDGVQDAYVPAHSTNWTWVYMDFTGPRDVFRNIDSVTVDCTPFHFEK